MMAADDPTDASRSLIRPLDDATRYCLTAGQVIEDLASCVKELVDNALDASSTCINIRLFNQGMDIVEVSDDGVGIPQQSRPSLALPHATSKLRNFEALSQLSSLGFRGEALFGLASLSANLVVATRTAQDTLAQKLEFGRDGKLRPGASELPRKVGTTVAVIRLLDAVPVRRADMQRRLPAQRGKLVKLMEAYALFRPGVRFHLMDILASGKEHTLLSSPANSSSLQETISSVVGSKVLATLSPFEAELAELFPAAASADGITSCYKIDGYLSRIQSSYDRGMRHGQYFSINGRPAVELPKVSRLLNDVWKTMGGNKKPTCIWNITVPPYAVDVNMTPDKRQVQLTCETELLALLQTAITDFWFSQSDGRFVVAAPIMVRRPSVPDHADDDESESGGDDNDSPLSPSRFNRRYAFSHNFNNARLQHEYDDGRQPSPQRNAKQYVAMKPRQISLSDSAHHDSKKRAHGEPSATDTQSNNDDPERAGGNNICEPDFRPRKRLRIQLHGPHHVDNAALPAGVTPSPPMPALDDGNDSGDVAAQSRQLSSISESSRPTDAEQRQWNDARRRFNRLNSATSSSGELEEAQERACINRLNSATELEENQERACTTAMPATETIKKGQSRFVQFVAQNRLDSVKKDGGPDFCKQIQEGDTSDTRVDFSPDSQMPNVNKDEIEDEMPGVAASSSGSKIVWDGFGSTEDVLSETRHERLALLHRLTMARRASALSSDCDPSNATTSLPLPQNVAVNKSDFKCMTVIGQFNMGFIIAISPDNDVWILDQHACDEKYNFERLCRETTIHEQTLIAPMRLELSPVEEMCVMDNLSIFEKNGFRFKVDLEQPPRHRLSLTALPHSGAQAGRKAVQFGKDDVVALCELLNADGSYEDSGHGGGTGVDGSGVYGNNAVRRYVHRSGDGSDKIVARLPKAISMFASRACRGSIMIGQGLSSTEMKRVVERLADIEHPWNCPHGRPTMRHLGNVSDGLLDDERATIDRLAGPTVTVLSQDVAFTDGLRS